VQQKLGSPVPPRCHVLGKGGSGAYFPGESKVADFDFEVVAEDVFGFEVAMEVAVFMKIG
jgi:hypothetical protein